MNIMEQRIENILSQPVEQMGYALIRVRFNGGNRGDAVLQVMAEPEQGGSLSLGDCQKLHDTINRLLDVEDPIKDAYRLEISSPGIDRPLTRFKDFVRYTTHTVKLEVSAPIEGRKRFKGEILACDEASERITLKQEGVATPVELPFSAIESARLVLTDALIAFSKAQQNNQKIAN